MERIEMERIEMEGKRQKGRNRKKTGKGKKGSNTVAETPFVKSRLWFAETSRRLVDKGEMRSMKAPSYLMSRVANRDMGCLNGISACSFLWGPGHGLGWPTIHEASTGHRETGTSLGRDRFWKLRRHCMGCGLLHWRWRWGGTTPWLSYNGNWMELGMVCALTRDTLVCEQSLNPVQNCFRSPGKAVVEQLQSLAK